MNATARRRLFKLAMLVPCFGVVALMAGQANAGCLDGLLHLTTPLKSSSPGEAIPTARFVPAVYRPADASSAFLRVDDRLDDESIVGLWQFQLDGQPPDFGTQAWHSDGTELMFSAGRDPAKGDVCQGVWRKVGPRTYSLNHIAMGWDFGYGTALLRVHIRAVVKLDRSGDSYSGAYKARVYLVTPANPFEEDDSNFQGEGTGNMTGTRVRPD
jgi:hypothetical protein